MSEDSSKLRIENVHETYHVNLYARVIGAEGILGWSRLRGWWMGRNRRASIEDSSVFIYIILSLDYIFTVIFQITLQPLLLQERFS